MSELFEFINSGILEMYVFGSTTPEQNGQIEKMANAHQQVKEELLSLEVTLEDYALRHAKHVAPTIKPFLFATMNYMERVSLGEKISFPPKLHSASQISDFNEWLSREDLSLSRPLNEFEAHIIASATDLMTAIVWIKNGAPPEVHEREIESFMILEGACNIVVGGQDHFLTVGDVFTIPLELAHHIVVTSEIPCKVLLQRVNL